MSTKTEHTPIAHAEADSSPRCAESPGSASSRWKAGGWDIMLQCTACGFRTRRHRNDYNGAIGDAPKPTVETTCSNCTANAGDFAPDVKTVHFIDYSTPAELADFASR